MRRAALSLVVLLAGCGGGSDEKQVTETVGAYLEAFADRDGERACEQLAFDAHFELFNALLLEAPLEAGRLVPAGEDV